MDYAFISVIIPSFNEEKFIGDCIRSITQSNYPKEKIEIVLVDNGSTDRTVAIANQLGVKIIVNKDKNIGGLRNLGAQIASGDILGFLDADCTVLPNWALNANDTLQRKEIGVTGSRLLAPQKGTWIELAWALHLMKNLREGETNYINSGNFFMRRDLFEKIGGFSQILKTSEDVDICERIRKQGYIIYNNPEISAIHWGYPKTLKEFFKREVWHGIGATQKTFPRFWESKPLALAFYNIFLFALALFALFLHFEVVVLIALGFYFFPNLLWAYKVSITTDTRLKNFLSLFILYCLYGVARIISISVVLKNKLRSQG